jgi:hypothetical protein
MTLAELETLLRPHLDGSQTRYEDSFDTDVSAFEGILKTPEYVDDPKGLWFWRGPQGVIIVHRDASSGSSAGGTAGSRDRRRKLLAAPTGLAGHLRGANIAGVLGFGAGEELSACR